MRANDDFVRSEDSTVNCLVSAAFASTIAGGRFSKSDFWASSEATRSLNSRVWSSSMSIGSKGSKIGGLGASPCGNSCKITGSRKSFQDSKMRAFLTNFSIFTNFAIFLNFAILDKFFNF